MQWVGNGKPCTPSDLKPDILLANIDDDCPAIPLRTPSRKGNFLLFHLPAMNDSAAYCTETTKGHHDRSSTQCWLWLQIVVQNVSDCSLHFLFCIYCTDDFFRVNICAAFTSLPRVYHTHLLFLQTVLTIR